MVQKGGEGKADDEMGRGWEGRGGEQKVREGKVDEGRGGGILCTTKMCFKTLGVHIMPQVCTIGNCTCFLTEIR